MDFLINLVNETDITISEPAVGVKMPFTKKFIYLLNNLETNQDDLLTIVNLHNSLYANKIKLSQLKEIKGGGFKTL